MSRKRAARRVVPPSGRPMWARKLKRYLDEVAGRSVNWYAEHKAGFSQSSLAAWMSGEHAIRADTWIRVLKPTGIALEFWANDDIPFDAYAAYELSAVRNSIDAAAKKAALTPTEWMELLDAVRSRASASKTLGLIRAGRQSDESPA